MSSYARDEQHKDGFVPQPPKKTYISPKVSSFENADEVLAWAASRGTPEQRQRAADLAHEMERIRAFHPDTAQRRTGR
jgi:hypothetical protein